jgi:hypothetical protein
MSAPTWNGLADSFCGHPYRLVAEYDAAGRCRRLTVEAGAADEAERFEPTDSPLSVDPPSEHPRRGRPTGGGGLCAVDLLDLLDRAGPAGIHFSTLTADAGHPTRTVTDNLERLVACGLVRQPQRRGPYVHVRHAGEHLPADEPAPADESPERPARGRPRTTARCAADIVLTIASRGQPCTLDYLANALEQSYSRSIVAATAARLKAAGDLVNGGNGYHLPGGPVT